jgi:hypothetical protein
MFLAWTRAMHCPRCEAPLLEQGPNRKWLRFFECEQCWLAFQPVAERHFEPCGHNPNAKFLRFTTTLQPGRTPRPADWMY